METLTLAAESRERGNKGKLAALRRTGQVPAVLYGLKSEPVLLAVKAADLRTLLPKRNHVVEIRLGAQSHQAMVKQVDRDPIRRDVLHVDFLRVDSEHPVTVSVPVLTHGIAVGVKTGGGVFSVAKKSVKLRAKVADIPEKFDIDVSGLENGQTFYVRDLKFDKGAFLTPGRTALFGVGTGHKEEEVAAPVAAAPAAGAAAPAAEGKDKAAPAAPAAGKGEAKGKK